jgi:group I intron endonuclease
VDTQIDFCGIYKISNIVNNKVYVGQSKNIYKRWQEHYYELKNNRNKNQHLQYSFNKYGEENFIFDIIEVCDIDSLDYLERHYIKLYNSIDRSFGYNNENGGNKGKIKSLESCLKISKSRIGKYSGENHPLYGIPRSNQTKLKLKLAITGKAHTEETKKKMSESHRGDKHPFYGKKLSEEHCKNIGIAKKGTVLSDETKEKMKKAHKGRKFTILTPEQIEKRIKNRKYTYGENHPSAKFTNENIREIKEMLILYSGNAKMVAEKLNLNKNTIQSIKNLQSWLKVCPEYNEQLILLKTKKRHNFSNEQLNEIRSQYQQKISMKDLSKIYDCSEETIRRIVKYIGYYEIEKEIN